MSVDVYSIIRENIIEQLSNGQIPWVKAFHVSESGCAYSHSTQNPYSFINQWLLKREGEYWTFNQALTAGLRVRKGAKSRFVVFWKVFEKKRDDGAVDKIPFLRYYNVFHESDIEGLPAKTPIDEADRETRNAERLDVADAIVNGYIERNPHISLQISARTTPCWSVTDNTIYCPEKSQFDSLNDYYSALFHEMVHSTAKKLSREFNYSNAQDRAREELVAEIGSAYLCGRCNISDDVIKNQSAYCQEWLKPLSEDIKMLVWASSRAEKAVKYILDEVDPEETE